MENSQNFVLQSNALPRKVYAMPTSTEAEEHLRVIRSLMEKATIYRAVSAPTALAGGVAAVLVATPPMQALFSGLPFDTSFHVRWLVALFITGLVNAGLIFREVRRRGDPMISPGMRAAFRSLIPAFFCGGVFFCVFGAAQTPAYLAIFYGLGLLATGHFAPTSIVWLGWGFLLAGLIVFIPGLTVRWIGVATPDLIMTATFGGFHFVYAACTWPRGAQSAAFNGPR